MKKIAIIIDASGSMRNSVHLYSLDHKLHPIIIKTSGGCDPREIELLLKKYDEVYFFSDGLFTDPRWSLIINPKLHVIKVTE